MAELLEVYDLKDNLIKVEERKKFYSDIRKEFSEKGKISKKVKAIRLLLMNSEGRIYLQKRSRIKSENPGLYDKTVGGHVSAGDTFDMTVIRECAEELGFPAAILSPEDFDRASKVTDLGVVGIFKKIDYVSDFESVRLTANGDKFIQPFMNAFYLGYYDGSIRFSDGESTGIEVFSFDELNEELKNQPDKFTEDIKFMVRKYEKFLKPIK